MEMKLSVLGFLSKPVRKHKVDRVNVERPEKAFPCNHVHVAGTQHLLFQTG